MSDTEENLIDIKETVEDVSVDSPHAEPKPAPDSPGPTSTDTTPAAQPSTPLHTEDPDQLRQSALELVHAHHSAVAQSDRLEETLAEKDAKIDELQDALLTLQDEIKFMQVQGTHEAAKGLAKKVFSFNLRIFPFLSSNRTVNFLYN
jgi:heme-binding NEAT domain protein